VLLSEFEHPLLNSELLLVSLARLLVNSERLLVSLKQILVNFERLLVNIIKKSPRSMSEGFHLFMRSERLFKSFGYPYNHCMLFPLRLPK
jgi:hypothetical protein